MYTAKEWSIALSRVLELTSKGEVVWSRYDPIVEDVWTETDASFVAEYKGSIYGVSQVRRRNYVDEDDFYWSPDYVFNFYERNESGNLLKIAAAPSSNVISNIFSLAQHSYAAKKSVLGNLLGVFG